MAPPSLTDLADAVSTGPAARRLGISDSYLRRLVRRGHLRAIWTPLGYLIPKAALEAYARRRERAAGAAGRAR